LQKSVCKVVRVVMPARVSGRLRETEKRIWRISVEFQTRNFYKHIPSHSDLIKIGQK